MGFSDLDAINRNHANTYIVNRSQTKLTPATLNMEFRFIKRFFNYCITMGWINLNPFFVTYRSHLVICAISSVGRAVDS